MRVTRPLPSFVASFAPIAFLAVLSAPRTACGGTGGNSAAPPPGHDWTRFGWDAARSSAPNVETGITAANVRSLVRQRVTLDGTVDVSAIHLHGVQSKGAAHDMFFVTTTYGKTIGIDADSGTVFWECTARSPGLAPVKHTLPAQSALRPVPGSGPSPGSWLALVRKDLVLHASIRRAVPVSEHDRDLRRRRSRSDGKRTCGGRLRPRVGGAARAQRRKRTAGSARNENPVIRTDDRVIHRHRRSRPGGTAAGARASATLKFRPAQPRRA
jgi:hypothetical protein